MYGLQLISKKINHSKNAFIRLFPPHLIQLQNDLDIKLNSYYIAGISSKNIYLGNSTAPNYVLVSNFSSSESTLIKLSVPQDKKMAWSTITTAIDSPSIYMMEGIVPSILNGNLKDKILYYQENNKKVHFDKWVPLNPLSFVMRTYDTNLHQNLLVKSKINSFDLIPTQKYLLEKQLDGFFCTDGALIHAQNSNKIFYLYYYRNQFVCLDTNLNMLYKANTIDTNSVVKIQIAKIESAKRITFSNPPFVVNKGGVVWGDKFFVRSALTARNENLKVSKVSAVIDVYSVNNGSYLYSFYISDYQDQKLSDFRIYDSTLVAMYDNHLRKYRLHLLK